MANPTLIVVSGPAGSGKTTLAYEIARRLPCPVVSRDEIKEGMLHTLRSESGREGLNSRTLIAFFEALGVLLARQVTVVADAAFQHKVWEPNLRPLMDLADIRLIQCHADHDTAIRRIAEHASFRVAHADQDLLNSIASGEAYFERFQRVALGVPSIDVETDSGYNPAIESIMDFLNSSRS